MRTSPRTNLFLAVTASAALTLALASCGDDPDLCGDVRCGSEDFCDRSDNTCKPAPTDSGTSDGGGGVGGGTGGGAGDAGAGSACKPECADFTPVCDEVAKQCRVCTAIAGCAGSTPVCDTAVEGGRCVGCMSDTDCPSSAPLCRLDTQTCVLADGGTAPGDDAGTTDGGELHSDGGTDAGETLDAGVGGGEELDGGADAGFDGGVDAGPPPTGESCTDPIPVEFTDGGSSVTFRIDTLGRAGDHNGTGLCDSNSTASQSGAELVYSLTLTATRTVNVVAAPVSGTSADAVLYVRDSPCSTGTQRACSDNPVSPSSPETVNMVSLPPGIYYLFFDSYVSSSGTGEGPMDITVTLTP